MRHSIEQPINDNLLNESVINAIGDKLSKSWQSLTEILGQMQIPEFAGRGGGRTMVQQSCFKQQRSQANAGNK